MPQKLEATGLSRRPRAGKFKLTQNQINQRRDRRTTCFDHDVGRFPIPGITDLIQIVKFGQRIGDLQERPIPVMPQTPKYFVWRRVEIHHPCTLMKIQSIVRP